MLTRMTRTSLSICWRPTPANQTGALNSLAEHKNDTSIAQAFQTVTHCPLSLQLYSVSLSAFVMGVRVCFLCAVYSYYYKVYLCQS